MSLYNTIFGMNAGLVVLMAPLLPRRPDRFPRFRDIFTDDEDARVKGDIYVYTRMGGGNSECWGDGPDAETGALCSACDADQVQDDERCVHRYDDDFDNTYSTFVFVVSDEDRPDLEALLGGQLEDLSERYRARLRELFADDGPKTRAVVETICSATAAVKAPAATGRGEG